MKSVTRPVNGLICTSVSTLATMGALLVITSTAAIAQTSTADTLQQSPQSGEHSDGLFSGQGNGQMGGMFDLFHRAVLGQPRPLSEFRQEQQETINSEASNFRARQLELLRQQQTSENTTAPAPQSGQN